MAAVMISLVSLGAGMSAVVRMAAFLVCVPNQKDDLRHRHEGGEAGQDFGLPLGAKRLEFEVSLQPETQGHHDMLAAKECPLERGHGSLKATLQG